MSGATFSARRLRSERFRAVDWRDAYSPRSIRRGLRRDQTGVGVVKYFAGHAVKRIACQLAIAQERAPGMGFDLSVLNMADASPLFRKNEA